MSHCSLFGLSNIPWFENSAKLEIPISWLQKWNTCVVFILFNFKTCSTYTHTGWINLQWEHFQKFPALTPWCHVAKKRATKRFGKQIVRHDFEITHIYVCKRACEGLSSLPVVRNRPNVYLNCFLFPYSLRCPASTFTSDHPGRRKHCAVVAF